MVAERHSGRIRAGVRVAVVSVAGASVVGVGPTTGMLLARAAAQPQTALASAPQATSHASGHDRGIFDGLDDLNPLEMVPAVLSNVAERLTGEHDPRVGRAATQLLLASERLVEAGLRSMARGTGVIAKGSSVLGKVLPIVSMTLGAAQVWKGWNELPSHQDGVLSIIHSKTGRTGLMQVLAGALLFVPGVGGALSGSFARVVAAANEMDYFASLDWPQRPASTPA